MQEKNNNNNNISANDDKIREYIDDLYDAVLQRSTPQQVEHYKKISSCIVEIYRTLSKHEISNYDDVVHILVSVLAVPILVLQRDKQKKSDSLKLIALSLVEEIETIRRRENKIDKSESGREMERLREMLHKSNFFNLRNIDT